MPKSDAALLCADLLMRNIALERAVSSDILNLYTRIPLERQRIEPNLSVDAVRPCSSPVGQDELVAVIVETREHPNLPHAVRKVVEILNIPVQIFHTARNRTFVKQSSLKDLITAQKVILTELEISLTAEESQRSFINFYNSLMTNAAFWEAMIGRKKILIFQTDAMICEGSAFSGFDFLAFDYIGSPWDRQRPEGLIVDGGNGGFSLRDWTRSVDIIHRFAPELWGGGEDAYFAFHLELSGGRVADPEEGACFSSQSTFRYRSLGAHKIRYMHWATQILFLAYCPDSARILTTPHKRLKCLAAQVLGVSRLAQPVTWLLGKGRGRSNAPLKNRPQA